MTNVTSVRIKAVKLPDKLRNLCRLVFATHGSMYVAVRFFVSVQKVKRKKKQKCEIYSTGGKQLMGTAIIKHPLPHSDAHG